MPRRRASARAGAYGLSQPGPATFFVVQAAESRGAIVPAHRLPSWLGTPDRAWTPTRAQAAQAEAALRTYLEWGTQNRDRFEPSAEDYARTFLPEVVASLPTFTRYYIGLDRDDTRQILIIGAAEAYTRPRGRDQRLGGNPWLRAVPHVYDGGCRYWRFLMDVATVRPIRFACNGNP